MLTIFAAMAELERETTLQRQAEWIGAARLAGKRFGSNLQRSNWDISKIKLR